MAFSREGPGDDKRRKREEALRALAEGAPARPTSTDDVSIGGAPNGAHSPLRPVMVRRRPRGLVLLASGVALLAVIALVVAHGLLTPASKARAIPAKLALDPTIYGIACLEYAAWSPDSTRLAIMGQQEQCGNPDDPRNYSYYPTIIEIIDPLSGKSLGEMRPDATIQRDLHLHAPQYITPVDGVANSGDLTQQGARYDGLVWSPDNKRLATPFAVDYASAPLDSTRPFVRLYGMYVVGVDGNNDHATAITEGAKWVDIAEWNMKTLQPVPFTPPLGSASQGGYTRLLPASLRYSWRPDGTLAGEAPLSMASAPASPPLGPVGNPDGGASFTIWQPIYAGPDVGSSQTPIYPAMFAMTEGQALAWSPDGTYLLNAQMASLRVQPSKQALPAPALVKMRDYPIAPVRDVAFDDALNAMQAHVAPGFGGAAFAWSPDGKRLAEAVQNDKTGAISVTIFDCASGAPLGSLTVLGDSNSYGTISGPGLMWAPNGSRVLAGSNGELFVLNPDALPKVK